MATTKKGDKLRNHPTQGEYIFEDGTWAWFNGLSRHEKAIEIRKHGKIVSFKRTYFN